MNVNPFYNNHTEEQIVDIDSITYYPYYDEKRHDGDVVILKLTRCLLVVNIHHDNLSDKTFHDIYQKSDIYPTLYVSWSQYYRYELQRTVSGPITELRKIEYAPVTTCNPRTNQK